MTEYRIVPDELRDEEPKRGREPKSNLSRMLLNGSTVFVPGPRKTWGSLYDLAKNHGMIAHVQRRIVNGEDGMLIWFDKPEE